MAKTFELLLCGYCLGLFSAAVVWRLLQAFRITRLRRRVVYEMVWPRRDRW